MKVLIAGGRNFSNYQKVCEICDYIIKDQSTIEIVSGAANGADKLGERYAIECGYPIKRILTNWNK